MKSLTILHGDVEHGQKRGKRLGFPTINFAFQEELPEGIYFSQTIVRGKTYNSLTFIGAAKTFGETKRQAETYILEFHQTIYGEPVSIALLEKIRENIKFASEEELIKQMEEDKRQAEEFFK